MSYDNWNTSGFYMPKRENPLKNILAAAVGFGAVLGMYGCLNFAKEVVQYNNQTQLECTVSEYIIQPGDTWYGILGVNSDIGNVIEYNRINNPNTRGINFSAEMLIAKDKSSPYPDSDYNILIENCK